MNRRDRRGKRAGAAKQWVMLEHYLLDCPAYASLSANAKAVYTELKRRYNGKNNGLISFSSREAGEAINATHHTGARALVELQQHCLIEVTEDSTFNRKVHLARQYLLTEAPDDRVGAERLPKKTFMRWSPPPEKIKTQSHPCDTTVAPMRHDGEKIANSAPNSITHATVKAKSPVPQSHPCDTYRLSTSQRERSHG